MQQRTIYPAVGYFGLYNRAKTAACGNNALDGILPGALLNSLAVLQVLNILIGQEHHCDFKIQANDRSTQALIEKMKKSIAN